MGVATCDARGPSRVYDARATRVLPSLTCAVRRGELSDRTTGATATWTRSSGSWRRWPSRPPSSASWRWTCWRTSSTARRTTRSSSSSCWTACAAPPTTSGAFLATAPLWFFSGGYDRAPARWPQTPEKPRGGSSSETRATAAAVCVLRPAYTGARSFIRAAG